MKKIILFILLGLSIYAYTSKLKANNSVKVPDSAIRFRVLANSNSPYDQSVKEKVRDRMQKQLYDLLKNTKSTTQARSLINDNINTFKKTLDNEMGDEIYSYKIDYGMHEFPEKKYKGITYEAGEYESLLITLGEGKGDNWWCVLFPPLCLLEAEEQTGEKTEYKSFVKEILEKYFD